MKVPTVENVLEEIDQDILQGNEINLSSFDMHDCLNRQFWPTDEKLDKEICAALLTIAKDFIGEMNLSEIVSFSGKLSDLVKDIQFLGSLASFNYSKYSDVDLHILFDFKPLNLDAPTKELLKKYFWQLKNDWNNKHIHLVVKGYEVELYVQDADEPNAANGVYSILKDSWVKFPKPMSSRNFDRDYVRRKVLKYKNQIDSLENLLCNDRNKEDTEKVLELLQYIKDKVIKARRAALAASGNDEMAEDNIVFKALRRCEYIGKINDLMTMGYDKMNSITESTRFTLTTEQLKKLIEEETGKQVDENWLTRQLGRLWGGVKKIAGNQNVRKAASGAWGAVKDAGRAVGNAVNNKLNQWQADAATYGKPHLQGQRSQLQAPQNQAQLPAPGNAGQDAVAAASGAAVQTGRRVPQQRDARGRFVKNQQSAPPQNTQAPAGNAGQDAAAGTAAGAAAMQNAPQDATAAAAGVAAGAQGANNAPGDATAAAAGVAAGANMAKNAPEDATAAGAGVAAGMKLSEYLTPSDVAAAVTAGVVAYIRNNAAPDDQQAQPTGGNAAPAEPTQAQMNGLGDVPDDSNVAIKGVIGKSHDEILRGKVWQGPGEVPDASQFTVGKVPLPGGQTMTMVKAPNGQIFRFSSAINRGPGFDPVKAAMQQMQQQASGGLKTVPRAVAHQLAMNGQIPGVKPL